MNVDLIVYNYCPSEVTERESLKRVERGISRLRERGALVDVVRLCDGNDLYPRTHRVLGKLAAFEYSRPDRANSPTNNIYQTLMGWTAYLDGVMQLSQVNDSEEIRQELLALKGSGEGITAFHQMILMTGTKYRLERDYYGVNQGKVGRHLAMSVNSNLNEKSIWHETAHLLGALDHYDPDTEKPISRCKESGCFMRYDATQGRTFCSESIEEINAHLSACER